VQPSGLRIQYGTGFRQEVMHPMAGRKSFTLRYRHHKACNCAAVTIGGKDHYLGARSTTASSSSDWPGAGNRKPLPLL
jgi:hypothetical protein